MMTPLRKCSYDVRVVIEDEARFVEMEIRHSAGPVELTRWRLNPAATEGLVKRLGDALAMIEAAE